MRQAIVNHSLNARLGFGNLDGLVAGFVASEGCGDGGCSGNVSHQRFDASGGRVWTRVSFHSARHRSTPDDVVIGRRCWRRYSGTHASAGHLKCIRVECVCGSRSLVATWHADCILAWIYQYVWNEYSASDSMRGMAWARINRGTCDPGTRECASAYCG